MKLNYDPQTDSLYIDFRGVPSSDSIELAADVVLDLDDDGVPVGLDVQHASRFVDLRRLEVNGLHLS